MDERVTNYLSEEVSTCLCDEAIFSKVYDEEMLLQFKLASFDCKVMNILFTAIFHSQKTFSLTVDNYCLSNIRYYVLLQRMNLVKRECVDLECIFFYSFLKEHTPFTCSVQISPKCTLSGVADPQVKFTILNCENDLFRHGHDDLIEKYKRKIHKTVNFICGLCSSGVDIFAFKRIDDFCKNILRIYLYGTKVLIPLRFLCLCYYYISICYDVQNKLKEKCECGADRIDTYWKCERVFLKARDIINGFEKIKVCGYSIL